MKILVVNAGSSSLKFQLFDVEKNYAVVAKGLCDNVGLATSKLKYTKTGNSEVELAIDMPNHSVATKTMSDALTGALCDKGFEGYEQACGKAAKCCGKLRKPLILQEKRVEISVESVENFFSPCRILHKNDQRAKLPQAVRWYISAFQ